MPGISAMRYETWISGWVRNTVSTFMSSCEWCSSWKRQRKRTRWLARWANQLHPSMATRIRAMAPQRGTVPTLGRMIQGRSRRAISEKERLSAVTRGTTRVALNTVKRRSWRWPRATSARRWAGRTRSITMMTPMTARVSGPMRTTRRLVMEGPKSDPPQWLAQPRATRAAATATMENAGR